MDSRLPADLLQDNLATLAVNVRNFRGLLQRRMGLTVFGTNGFVFYYATGTVSGASGQKVLTGSGTSWTAANIKNGDILTVGGVSYTVDYVSSDTSLNVTANLSATVGAGTSYTVSNPLILGIDQAAFTDGTIVPVTYTANAAYYYDGTNWNYIPHAVSWGLVTAAQNINGDTITAAPYGTGTVSSTLGSRTVTGSGTVFNTSSSAKGDRDSTYLTGDVFVFNAATAFYRIRSVDSATQITLTEPFKEASLSGVTYAIGPVAGLGFPKFISVSARDRIQFWTGSAWDAHWYDVASVTDTVVTLRVKNVINSTYTRARVVKTWSAAVTNKFSSAMIRDRLIFANGNLPRTVFWGPMDTGAPIALSTPIRDLTPHYSYPDLSGPVVVSEFANRVLEAAVNNAPQLIRWSASGDEEDHVNTGSGSNVLTVDPSWINGFATIRDALFCYKERSITAILETGNALAPFNFREGQVDGVGAYRPLAINNIGEDHLFFGADNIYIYDGTTLQPVGNPIWQEFFDNLDPSNDSQIFIDLLEEFQEVWIGVVQPGDTYPKRFWVYNYNDNLWTYNLFSTAITAMGYYQRNAQVQIENLIGSINAQGFRFNDRTSLANFPTNLVGASDYKVYQLDPTVDTDNGTAFTSTWRSKEFRPWGEENSGVVRRVSLIYRETGNPAPTIYISTDGGNTLTALTANATSVVRAGGYRTALYDTWTPANSFMIEIDGTSGTWMYSGIVVEWVPAGFADIAVYG